MNIKLQGNNSMLLVQQSLFLNSGLKSTQQKLERQAKCENQVAFYENQKNNLKNVVCENLEDIAEKLDMLHTYEDQIAAVKAQYNHEQMSHVLDEAMEKGEKIAKTIEKTKPKTPEERAEDQAKEALGIEDEGVLTEILDELTEIIEETIEEAAEVLEETTESLADQSSQEVESMAEQIPEEAESFTQQTEQTLNQQNAETLGELPQPKYKRFDMRA